jgi:chromosome partitioning protein
MIIIAFISQKGGVGKSTLTRALAREAAAGGMNVKVADLDTDQATVVDWHRMREHNKIEPSISVELFRNVAEAIKASKHYDLLIVDGPARASASTTEISKVSSLVVQPTGPARDDLNPAIRVFHGLVKQGIPEGRMVFALNRVGTDNEADLARAYIDKAGFATLPGYLPERPAYRIAQNDGYAVTETKFTSLKKQADTLVQSLIDRVGEASGG